MFCHDAAVEQLTGRVAVVTGAGSGIGRSLAHRLTAAGMRIVAADVEERALAETMLRLDEATSLVIDVSRYDDVVALADHAYATFGSVDVLCNNAGVFAGGFMWERPAADFEWTLGVNLWGILHGIRAFVPRMIASGSEGHIVNTVSMAGLCTNAYSGPYTVSKFAALAASECLAHDLAAAGVPIKVSTVVPGRVSTRIAASSRNRPARLAGTASEDAQFVEQMLAEATTHDAMEPDAAADLVVAAIRAGTYLVPTRASYAAQLRERFDALLDRRLPPMPAFD
jgi:NAD(P)-dependent dehydrogenase (short-subunit alcohol dehydrogenase family)